MCSSPSSCSQLDQRLEPVLRDRQLGERPAEHDRDPVLAVALELGLRGSRSRSAVPQPSLTRSTDSPGDLDQPVDLGDRQAAVEHVGDAPAGGAWRSDPGGRAVRHADAAGLEALWCSPGPRRRVTTTLAVHGVGRRARHRLRARIDRLHRRRPELQRRGDGTRVLLEPGHVGDDRRRVRLVGGVRGRALLVAVPRASLGEPCARPVVAVPFSTATVTEAGLNAGRRTAVRERSVAGTRCRRWREELEPPAAGDDQQHDDDAGNASSAPSAIAEAAAACRDPDRRRRGRRGGPPRGRRARADLDGGGPALRRADRPGAATLDAARRRRRRRAAAAGATWRAEPFAPAAPPSPAAARPRRGVGGRAVRATATGARSLRATPRARTPAISSVGGSAGRDAGAGGARGSRASPLRARARRRPPARPGPIARAAIGPGERTAPRSAAWRGRARGVAGWARAQLRQPRLELLDPRWPPHRPARAAVRSRAPARNTAASGSPAR